MLGAGLLSTVLQCTVMILHCSAGWSYVQCTYSRARALLKLASNSMLLQCSVVWSYVSETGIMCGKHVIGNYCSVVVIYIWSWSPPPPKSHWLASFQEQWTRKWKMHLIWLHSFDLIIAIWFHHHWLDFIVNFLNGHFLGLNDYFGNLFHPGHSQNQ